MGLSYRGYLKEKDNYVIDMDEYGNSLITWFHDEWILSFLEKTGTKDDEYILFSKEQAQNVWEEAKKMIEHIGEQHIAETEQKEQDSFELPPYAQQYSNETKKEYVQRWIKVFQFFYWVQGNADWDKQLLVISVSY